MSSDSTSLVPTTQSQTTLSASTPLTPSTKNGSPVSYLQDNLLSQNEIENNNIISTNSNSNNTNNNNNNIENNQNQIKKHKYSNRKLTNTSTTFEVETQLDNDNKSILSNKNEIHVTWKQILGGSIGNILEWYDFAVFGYLANNISNNFFPKGNKSAGLLATYGIFGGAFIIRPLGGLLFGNLGDKIGRKKALQLSMILMFISTFTLGCLPTYNKIGFWSAVLLTVLRLFQGLSVGGQLVGSMLFLVESSKPAQKGFYGAVVMCTAGMGSQMGSIFVGVLQSVTTKHSMNKYGWRIPFISSSIIGFFGYLLTINMERSKEFEKLMLNKSLNIKKSPISHAVKFYYKHIIYIAMVDSTWCVGFYCIFIWVPNYIQHDLSGGYKHAVTLNSIMFCWGNFMLLVGGYLSDRIKSYYFVMKIGSTINFLTCFVLFYLIGKYRSHNWWPMVLLQFITSIGLGLFGGPMQHFMIDSINDVSIRYSVMGIAYNISQALFGGTAPVVSESLAIVSLIYVGLYVGIISFISLLSVILFSNYFNKHKSKGYTNLT